MSRILIVGEHANGKLNSSTAKCVTCARGLPGAEITVVVLGADTRTVAQAAAGIAGVAKVLRVDNAANRLRGLAFLVKVDRSFDLKIASFVMIHFETFLREGRLYITSSITVSIIERRARAPVPRSIAFSTTDLSACSSNSSSTPSIAKSF